MGSEMCIRDRDIGPHEAGAEPSPVSTKHTGKASCGHPGNAKRHTSSNTGPARPYNLDRKIGCTAACAWMPLNANSSVPRAPVSCLPDIAKSITTRGAADSVASSRLSARTSGTRVDIIFGGSGKFPHTLQLPDSRQVVRFLDEPEPVKLALSSARYTTALGAVRGSWCLQVHQGKLPYAWYCTQRRRVARS